MRWRMCRKCHVKLIETNEGINGECVIEKCPICKDYYLTIFPNTDLISELRRLAKINSKSMEELIRDSLNSYIKNKN